MINLFLILWQLPQNLLGYLVIGLLNAYLPAFDTDPKFYLHYKTWFSSVSLGDFIILNGYCYTEITIKHEIGHQKQSKILGWFYLPVIGILSVIGNLLHRIFKFNYYSLPWEKWADKLGGVKRY